MFNILRISIIFVFIEDKVRKSIVNIGVNSSVISDSFNDQTLHLQLKNEPLSLRERVSQILSEFTLARVEHNLWKDPLSNEIFHWMIQVKQYTSDEEFNPHQDEVLAELANEILVNPLRLRPSFFSTGIPEIVPLENPLLDGDWAWEKDTWLDYRATLLGLHKELISFDGKPLKTEPTPHNLAIAMLKLLPPKADNTALEDTSAAPIPLNMKLITKLMLYNAHGSNAIFERKNKEKEKEEKDGPILVAQIIESVRKEFQEARRQERERINELLKQESIKRDEMIQRIKVLEETLKSVSSELAEIKAEKESIQSQVTQLTATTETQINEINRLSNVVDQKNKAVAAVLEAARAAAAAAANSGRRKGKKRWYKF